MVPSTQINLVRMRTKLQYMNSRDAVSRITFTTAKQQPHLTELDLCHITITQCFDYARLSQHRPNRRNNVVPHSAGIAPSQDGGQLNRIRLCDVLLLALADGLGDVFVLQQDVVLVIQIKAAQVEVG